MTITARQIAADVLNRSRSRDAFAAELIEDAVSGAGVTPLDRRFLTQLVFGVIRRKGALDALLLPFIQLPVHAVQPRVWDILHLGAFQLAFLTHVPKHAAVNETVELANHIGSPKAKGFVNGVLRRVSELVTDEFTGKPGADALPFDGSPHSVRPHPPTPSPQGRGGENQSPLSPGERGLGGEGQYRRLTRAVLPDPITAPSDYLATGFSFPKWLADRWLDHYGPEECTRLGFWFNSPPPLWIRVNKLHNKRETYRLQLAAQLIGAETGEHPQSIHFLEHHPIREIPGYDVGDFAVQDHSAMLVASALSPQPGMHILDLCAAPGGKTTHLAELMDNRGRVTACDIDAKRLETVASLSQRLGLKGIEPVVMKENGDPPPGPFDAALVDVPCSNTGVLGRRPEVRWRLKPNEFEYLIRLQTRLLIQAIERVKPGGAIVYSTCSIEPDENERLIKGVCKAMKGLTIEAEHQAIPGKPADGGYWARLRKRV
ncbi:MAG TPA: transcription antitermination factor NusB [Gemmata sp.]|nr:transcription antitermination factor NusB [Gemmata sp.]